MTIPLHAIIVGCGRVGAGMARRLTQEGYTVTVIDRTTRAFTRLEGTRRSDVIGMGYDRGTLLEAGVERAEVLAAVTNGDNTNIVVARTAREHFHVPKVVARIYDPRRAAIYERLGISTVASAQLTTELAVRRVLPDDAGVRWVDPSANVCVVDRTVPSKLAGHALTDDRAVGPGSCRRGPTPRRRHRRHAGSRVPGRRRRLHGGRQRSPRHRRRTAEPGPRPRRDKAGH